MAEKGVEEQVLAMERLPCVDMSHYVYVPRLDTLPYVGVAVLSHTVCAVNDARNAGNALYVFTYIAMVYAVYSQL